MALKAQENKRASFSIMASGEPHENVRYQGQWVSFMRN